MSPLWRYLFGGRNQKRRHSCKDCPRQPAINEDGFIVFSAPDCGNPREWPLRRKWAITICTSLLTMIANLAASFTSGNLSSIARDFNISETAAGLTTTVFLVGFAVGSFIFAPLSESFGRRIIHLTTYPTYLAFTALCAVAPNFATLLIGRFMASVTVSASMSNTPGILADLWADTDRGNPMALYSLTAWVAPSIGPIIGGFVEMKGGWRWAMYILLCINGVTTLAMLYISETCGPVILKKRAKMLREELPDRHAGLQSQLEASTKSIVAMYKEALTRPWALLFDLINFLCAMYMAVVFTLQFMLLSIYPFVFQTMRGWNKGVGQLPLLGTVVGALAAAVLIVLDTKRRKKKNKLQGQLEPEDRLLIGIIGGVGFPIAMFWFAWTANYNSIHWLVPTIGGGVLSGAMMLIFVSWTNYIIDTYGQFATSAAAANVCTRSLASASAPLFTNTMFKRLGVGGGGSLIGGVATLLAASPVVLYFFGFKVRAKSKYAAGGDDTGGVEEVSEEEKNTGKAEREKGVKVRHEGVVKADV